MHGPKEVHALHTAQGALLKIRHWSGGDIFELPCFSVRLVGVTSSCTIFLGMKGLWGNEPVPFVSFFLPPNEMCSFAQYRPHTEIVSQIEQTFPASPRLSSDFCFHKSPQYASARSGSRFRITAHRNKSCLVLRLSLFALQRVGVFFRDSQCCKCQLYGGLSSTRKSLRLANLSEEWNCYSLQRAPLKNLYFDSLPIFVESEKSW